MAGLLSSILARAEQFRFGKSMADLHPDLLGREHIASFRSDGVLLASPYSYLSALGDYTSHVWVRKAVTVLANSIAPLPLKIMRKDKEVEQHPFLDLLQYVNPSMSAIDLWQQWVVDMLLGGEEGWEFTKGANQAYVEIFPRQPHTITIVPERGRERYFQAAEYLIDDGSGLNPYALDTSEFLLFKFYNPRNPWRGLAPISAVRMAVSIDVFAQAWSRLFFSKGARPDYAVITPEGVTESEREELERKLATKFGGTENWFKPIVLENGVTDIKPLDFRPKDLEWVAQREMSRDEIGAIFGVPDEIMGYGRDTYENFETAHWVLWTLTILPLCGLRDVHLTRFGLGTRLLAEGESIVTDTSQVVALKKDLVDKIDGTAKLWGMGVAFNLASKFTGLGLEIPNGDIAYLSPNLVSIAPDGSAAPLVEPPPPPAPVVAPPASDAPVDVPEPDADADAAPPAAGEETPKGKRLRQKSLPFGSLEHQQKWEAHGKRVETHEKRLGRILAALFEEQREEVMTRLRKRKQLVGVYEIESKTPQDVANNPFDMDSWMAEFRKRCKPILADVVLDAGTAALLEIASDVVFEINDPRVTEFLLLRNQRFAERVNETTWQQLKDSLTAGLNDGESLVQFEERVQSIMAERIRSSKETIARTEVNGALNGGTLEGWQQSGVVEKKEWLSTFDNRTRGQQPKDEFDHVAAHGEQTGLDDFFIATGEPLMHPGADGSAGNVINCRCSMVAVIDVKRRSPAPLLLIPVNGNGHG